MLLSFARKNLSVFMFFFLFNSAIAEDQETIHNECKNSFRIKETNLFNYKLSSVKYKHIKNFRAYFFDPNGKEINFSKTSKYLNSGDQVIISLEKETFVCVGFLSDNGKEAIGWIEKKNLGHLEDYGKYTIELFQWIGEWRTARGTKISITRKKKSLLIEGNQSIDVLDGISHEGDFKSKINPERKNKIRIQDSICEVTLELLGTYLLVSDNSKCGGQGIEFTGLYRKSAKFKKIILTPLHDELIDKEFYYFYNNLLKEVKVRNTKYVISLFAENIKCNLGGGDNKSACLKDFHLLDNPKEFSHFISKFWNELEILLESGGKQISKKEFYFPSVDFVNLPDINILEYSLVMGNDIPLYKSPNKKKMKNLSFEFIQPTSSYPQDMEWQLVRTNQNELGYIKKKYLRTFTEGEVHLVVEKINGKWLITSFIGGI